MQPRDAEQIPDLLVEIYTPRLREKKEYFIDQEKLEKMARDLEKVSAKFRYILVITPCTLREVTLFLGSDILPEELPHPPIKMVFQEHKFGSENTIVRSDKRKK